MLSNKFSGSGRVVIILMSFLLWLSPFGIRALPQDGAPFEEDLTITGGRKSQPSLDDCRSNIIAPPKNKSMFFTGLGTRQDIKVAERYAELHGLIQVSNVYPADFSDYWTYTAFNDEKRQFQRDLVQIYAEQTTGTAYLMIDDGKEPASDSIFSTVEFPAMRDGNKVDQIIRIPFTNPLEDPTTSTDIYWSKPADAPDYATGRCRVHIIQYESFEWGSAHSIEARLYDNHGFEIGYQPRIDGNEPIAVTSKLPYELIIKASAPGLSRYMQTDDVKFEYGDQLWAAGDQASCTFGKYEGEIRANRDGDCTFTC